MPPCVQYCSQPGLAVVALAARVDEAADADAVADLVLGDLGADLGDDAGDLVAGHHAGSSAGPTRPLTVWMSEWQMPANLMSKATSCGPTSRRSMVVLVEWLGGGVAAYAETVVVMAC